MSVPDKSLWKVAASSGDPRAAVDGFYATAWRAEPSIRPSFEIDFEIDLGAATELGGLEVYWGQNAPTVFAFESSLDGETWSRLCGTRHGEGGQDVFAFPATPARLVRLTCEEASERALEIVEINLYGPNEAARALEAGRNIVFGRAPIKLPAGESVTIDLGALRSPLGVFVEWGKAYGTDFSVDLSDDGKSFRDVGRIATGDGGSDSFWWRSTKARFLKFTVHAASSPDGADINELKLRILNKDRMPIGQLEQAATDGRGDLYPQSLLGRQVY